mgnify:CR=1 FL=1
MSPIASLLGKLLITISNQISIFFKAKGLAGQTPLVNLMPKVCNRNWKVDDCFLILLVPFIFWGPQGPTPPPPKKKIKTKKKKGKGKKKKTPRTFLTPKHI